MSPEYVRPGLFEGIKLAQAKGAVRVSFHPHILVHSCVVLDNVRLQVSALSETLLAIGTGMRLLASVNENMPIKVPHRDESSVAGWALEGATKASLCCFAGVRRALVQWIGNQREMRFLEVVKDFRRAIEGCSANWTQMTLIQVI